MPNSPTVYGSPWDGFESAPEPGGLDRPSPAGPEQLALQQVDQ